MATKEKGGKGGKNAAPAKGGKGGAGGAGAAKGGKQGGASKSSKGAEAGRRAAEKASRGPHTGAALVAIAPRLKRYYTETVRDRLAKQFSLANVHQIPTLEKIVLNCGVGEAIKTPKVLDSVCEELELITGQRPIRRKAKKSIANYGLREGQEIGAQVTLRGARMWEFLDRFVTVSIPRIRDFRGLGTRAFDGRGNYSLGIKEQMIFPEINYDMVEAVHGMDITFVTSSTKDDQALALLRELGMPFKGESPNIPTLT
jgi:large subunit ribosomal protein L5